MRSLPLFKLYFIVTAFRFNPTHMQAWQAGLALVSPRPAEPLPLCRHSSWPEGEFSLRPVTAGVRSLSRAVPSLAVGAEHPSSLPAGCLAACCGELQTSLQPPWAGPRKKLPSLVLKIPSLLTEIHSCQNKHRFTSWLLLNSCLGLACPAALKQPCLRGKPGVLGGFDSSFPPKLLSADTYPLSQRTAQ